MRCADRSIIVPWPPADTDDTARALLTLNLSGKAAKPDQMIDHFKSENGHFRTFPGERDASFSSNCNVLKALIHTPNVEDYSPSISSIATFLSDSWWSGTPEDKWVDGDIDGTIPHEADYH